MRDGKVETEVRIAAANMLWQLGQMDEAAEALLMMARNARMKEGSRQAAVDVLRHLGRVEDLVVLARDVKLDRLRHAAVEAASEALGRLNRVEELEFLAQDVETDPEMRRAAVKALDRLNRQNETVADLLTLAWDVETDRGRRGVAARKLGRLAGRLLPEQGYALAHFATALEPKNKLDEDILQRLAWGMQEAQWSDPRSATWLLPLVEGTFEGRKIHHALRDAAWEGLSKLAPLADQMGNTTRQT